MEEPILDEYEGLSSCFFNALSGISEMTACRIIYPDTEECKSKKLNNYRYQD